MSDATETPDNSEILNDPALEKQTVTNDAVAGETVIETGHYAGATGSEPLEGAPTTAGNELADEEIDLADEE